MNILVKCTDILAVGVVEESDSIIAPGVVFPKHVIPGWQIVDVDLPAGFTPDGYSWIGGAVVKKPDPPPDPIAVMGAVVIAVQELLDRTARDRNYDNIFTLCTYAGDEDPIFDAEGRAAKAWRSAVWSKCRQIMGDVTAGTRPLPTVEEVIADLPAFVWP